MELHLEGSRYLGWGHLRGEAVPSSLAYVCLLTLLSLAALPSPGQLEVCVLLRVQADHPQTTWASRARHLQRAPRRWGVEAGFWLVGSLVALRIEPKASDVLGKPLLLSYTPSSGMVFFPLFLTRESQLLGWIQTKVDFHPWILCPRLWVTLSPLATVAAVLAMGRKLKAMAWGGN